MIPCPVCERMCAHIKKWRGIYICSPCSNKFEKIEKIIKEGQILNGKKLETILREFGPEEMEEIKKASNILVKKRGKRGRKQVDKNEQANIKAPPKRKGK